MRKFIAVLLALAMTFMLGACAEIPEPEPVTAENAEEIMKSFRISVNYPELVKGEVPEGIHDDADLSDVLGGFMFEMPSISNYPLSVEGNGDVDIEIFVPQEDNGSGILDFVAYAANSFNAKQYTLESGETVSISVRSLEASLAEDYILSGSYYPEGYIASNEMYGCLMDENGIEVSLVAPRTVGNTMGIVLEKSKYDELCGKYGELDIAKIVEANANGDVSVGYTNPTNNPTGLNFVISMLSYFDASNPMSMEATTDFSNFQNAVPMVSYSTSQMISAVQTGKIDAFVLERQAYENDANLSSSFVFMTFGVRHDNPLYAIGNLEAEETEAMNLFKDYIQQADIQQYATELGFNKDDAYVSTVSQYSGGMISTVLEFWKTEKASGKQIVAVFVADKSGSMEGRKLEALKGSLKTAMQYVGEECKVGLVSYASDVDVDLPIGDFNHEQQEYFVGAVEGLDARGGTATNDALLIAIRLINDEMAVNPEIKPIIILLSDGETSGGYPFRSVKELIDFYDYPIYTIGYEANVRELEKIASLNNGAFIDASSDDISYILKTLFDAEM